MRIVKNIFSQLHLYLLWLLAAALLWGLVFTRITDAPIEQKVTVFIDAPCEDLTLRERLEQHRPEGIRMIFVHPFTYAMFDESTLLNADIYIVPASRVAEYQDSFAPAPAALGTVAENGGITVYHDGHGIAQSLIGYGAEGTEEDYYLFIGVHSRHALSVNGVGDDAALQVAADLLEME